MPSTRFDTDNYMRREFDKIIKQYGHDILLQKVDTTTPPDQDMRWTNKMERHTVRFSVTANRALPGIGQQHPEGVINTNERIYYFRYDANPFENDRIYEEEIRPSAKQSVWLIDGVAPMYGIGGNLVYWVCGATRIRPN